MWLLSPVSPKHDIVTIHPLNGTLSNSVFLQLTNTSLYGYNPLVYGHLGYFHSLAIKNNVAVFIFELLCRNMLSSYLDIARNCSAQLCGTRLFFFFF